MEDYTIDIMLDSGPSARSVQLTLSPFTLVGATTKLGNLTSPMRDRFGVVLRLDFYNVEDLEKIIKRSSKILDISIDDRGALEIARRSRGTPRIANRLLRRARDFAQVNAEGDIDHDIAQDALDKLKIDQNGLDEMDRRILSSLVSKFNGNLDAETRNSARSHPSLKVSLFFRTILSHEFSIPNPTPKNISAMCGKIRISKMSLFGFYFTAHFLV